MSVLYRALTRAADTAPPDGAAPGVPTLLVSPRRRRPRRRFRPLLLLLLLAIVGGAGLWAHRQGLLTDLPDWAGLAPAPEPAPPSAAAPVAPPPAPVAEPAEPESAAPPATALLPELPDLQLRPPLLGLLEAAVEAEAAEAPPPAAPVAPARPSALVVQLADAPRGAGAGEGAALLAQAVALQRAGDTAAAIAVYEAVLAADPDNVIAGANLLGLIGQQQPGVALDRLRALHRRHPENAAVAAQLGVTEAMLGNADSALALLEQAVAREPDNPAFRYNLAVIADRAGRGDLAIRHYEAALALSPSGAEDPAQIAILRRLQHLRAR